VTLRVSDVILTAGAGEWVGLSMLLLLPDAVVRVAAAGLL
jgi:hypothetical protein